MLKRRTPLARGSGLRSAAKLGRRARLLGRRATPRRSERVRDAGYLDAVRGMPCVAWGLGGCDGPIEAHHAGPRPLGRKADDRTAIPLCRRHHEEWHLAGGVFGWMGRDGRRVWAEAAIRETRARFDVARTHALVEER